MRLPTSSGPENSVSNTLLPISPGAPCLQQPGACLRKAIKVNGFIVAASRGNTRANHQRPRIFDRTQERQPGNVSVQNEKCQGSINPVRPFSEFGSVSRFEKSASSSVMFAGRRDSIQSRSASFCFVRSSSWLARSGVDSATSRVIASCPSRNRVA